MQHQRIVSATVKFDGLQAAKLDLLPGPELLAKSAHFEQLLEVTLDRTSDGDLLFLVGMFLYCDGEMGRARKFLQRAADLAGPEVTSYNFV